MNDVALKRTDMVGPGALEKMREHGAIKGEIQTGTARGGLRFDNAVQMMDFAKLMSVADIAVPKHLRGNPGACLRIIIQADEWSFSPFAVADKSYLVNDRMAFESQLIHSVVERRAPMEGRLRPTWTGEGPTRRCKVTGRLIGETEPFIWEGPMIKDIKIKNSPEWANNPDKQLWFHATRDWARIYVPDVLMGVYSRDELDADYGRRDQGNTGTIADRLQPRADGAEGFDAQGIAKTLGIAHEVSDDPDAAKEPAEAEATTSPRKRSTKADKAAMAETPAEEAEHVGQALEPATQAEYIAYASKWIGKATDRDDAAARWDGERELRAACKVSVTERKALEKALKAKLETLT